MCVKCADKCKNSKSKQLLWSATKHPEPLHYHNNKNRRGEAKIIITLFYDFAARMVIRLGKYFFCEL